MNIFLCPSLPISFQVVYLVDIIALVVFDVFVVILTAYRTARLAFQSRQAHISGSLSFIILRDGRFFWNGSLCTTFITGVVFFKGCFITGTLLSLKYLLYIQCVSQCYSFTPVCKHCNKHGEYLSFCKQGPTDLCHWFVLKSESDNVCCVMLWLYITLRYVSAREYCHFPR